MGTPKEKKLAMRGLVSAQGYVQQTLARRIKMRAFPEIRIELDESIEKAFKVTNMIDKLARERKARERRARIQDGSDAAPATSAEEE